MPSNNTKYSIEMREQTAKFILESGKSATRVSEEMGIDKNTVCRWVRDYRRKHHLPTYSESMGIKTVSSQKDRESSRQLKQKEKQIRELQEQVEILKKSLRIFMQPQP